MQDTAVGEFAVVKTALNSHLLQSYSSADDYSENLSSKQIADFGHLMHGIGHLMLALTCRCESFAISYLKQ